MKLKYKDLFLDSFMDLTTSNGLYELNTRLSDWISKIFGSKIILCFSLIKKINYLKNMIKKLKNHTK